MPGALALVVAVALVGVSGRAGAATTPSDTARTRPAAARPIGRSRGAPGAGVASRPTCPRALAPGGHVGRPRGGRCTQPRPAVPRLGAGRSPDAGGRQAVLARERLRDPRCRHARWPPTGSPVRATTPRSVSRVVPPPRCSPDARGSGSTRASSSSASRRSSGPTTRHCSTRRSAALAAALDANGLGRAVIGNADGVEAGTVAAGVPEVQRPAVAGLMGSDGTVPDGRVDDGLLEAAPRAPFGVRLATDAVTQRVREHVERPGRGARRGVGPPAGRRVPGVHRSGDQRGASACGRSRTPTRSSGAFWSGSIRRVTRWS